jgi:hypothetical protein
MLRTAFCFCLLLIVGSTAMAAVVYAPVQYEYRDPYMNAPAFYYGGSNPAFFDEANVRQQWFNMSPSNLYIGTSYAREGRYAFNLVNSSVTNIYPMTYTDLLEPGVNAYPYGFSVSDARNAAYANVPLYFRKRDLLASAYRAPDGNLIVPAEAPAAGTIEIKPAHAPPPTTQPATAPAATPSPILIIPKRLLNKPLKTAGTPVASAK